jgi:hypothetical protein
MGLKIAGVVFIITMLYLVSYEGRSRYEDVGITQIEKREIEEAEIARQVAHINERDRKRELRSELEKHHPSPRAHSLGDGIQGDIPIEDLMKGLKGFL